MQVLYQTELLSERWSGWMGVEPTTSGLDGAGALPLSYTLSSFCRPPDYASSTTNNGSPAISVKRRRTAVANVSNLLGIIVTSPPMRVIHRITYYMFAKKLATVLLSFHLWRVRLSAGSIPNTARRSAQEQLFLIFLKHCFASRSLKFRTRITTIPLR